MDFGVVLQTNPPASRVVTTLSRGRVVIDDGQYLGSTGHGTFLARGLNQYLL